MRRMTEGGGVSKRRREGGREKGRASRYQERVVTSSQWNCISSDLSVMGRVEIGPTPQPVQDISEEHLQGARGWLFSYQGGQAVSQTPDATAPSSPLSHHQKVNRASVPSL